LPLRETPSGSLAAQLAVRSASSCHGEIIASMRAGILLVMALCDADRMADFTPSPFERVDEVRRNPRRGIRPDTARVWFTRVENTTGWRSVGRFGSMRASSPRFLALSTKAA